MRVTDERGQKLDRITVELTIGEAKWLLDRLEDQLEDYPESSDFPFGEVVKLRFDTEHD